MNSISSTHYERASYLKIMMSLHAAKRARQRAVPASLIPLIKTFGEMSHDGRGGIRYLMTDRSVEHLIRTIGYTKKLESLAGCYVVVAVDDPNRVITVAHRN